MFSSNSNHPRLLLVARNPGGWATWRHGPVELLDLSTGQTTSSGVVGQGAAFLGARRVVRITSSSTDQESSLWWWDAGGPPRPLPGKHPRVLLDERPGSSGAFLFLSEAGGTLARIEDEYRPDRPVTGAPLTLVPGTGFFTWSPVRMTIWGGAAIFIDDATQGLVSLSLESGARTELASEARQIHAVLDEPPSVLGLGPRPAGATSHDGALMLWSRAGAPHRQLLTAVRSSVPGPSRLRWYFLGTDQPGGSLRDLYVFDTTTAALSRIAADVGDQAFSANSSGDVLVSDGPASMRSNFRIVKADGTAIVLPTSEALGGPASAVWTSGGRAIVVNGPNTAPKGPYGTVSQDFFASSGVLLTNVPDVCASSWSTDEEIFTVRSCRPTVIEGWPTGVGTLVRIRVSDGRQDEIASEVDRDSIELWGDRLVFGVYGEDPATGGLYALPVSSTTP